MHGPLEILIINDGGPIRTCYRDFFAHRFLLCFVIIIYTGIRLRLPCAESAARGSSFRPRHPSIPRRDSDVVSEPNGCPLYAFHIRRKRALMSIGSLGGFCSFAGTAAIGHAHP